MTSESVQSILDNCSTVLFDFDGPLCDVFGGMPAPQIARELERLAGCEVRSDDPLEVLRVAFAKDQSIGYAVEDALVLAEVEAVRVADAELVGVHLLRKFAENGKRVGIVSNNSEQAIRQFLGQWSLTDFASVVVGRAFRRPDLMKPSPWPVLKAVERLGGVLAESFLIGDSLTDIEAARRAGIKCIAFANKLDKVALFTPYDVPVVTEMSQICR